MPKAPALDLSALMKPKLPEEGTAYDDNLNIFSDPRVAQSKNEESPTPKQDQDKSADVVDYQDSFSLNIKKKGLIQI